jgi:hypothetical protein
LELLNVLAGRVRQRKVVDFSDDEDSDGDKPEWASKAVYLSESARAIAIRWLRTARARIQSGGGDASGPQRASRAPTRRPGEKASKSKQEKKQGDP